MKLLLTLTLLWTIYSSAGALQCSTCSGSCTNPVLLNCTNGEQMCGTASVSGPQRTSLHVGVASVRISAECCNSDNCNNKTLAVPIAPANVTNSLKCFTCDPITSQCNITTQCEGVEDRCFNTTVSLPSVGVNRNISGCASSNLCTTSAAMSFLQLLTSGNITSGPSCCTGNLCNSATTSSHSCFTLSLMHLLVGLLIFSIF
ncbi:sperm acrosome membrane-associated protein 4-like isoform X2 [Thalassophryne amazonica]|uniref:sperm acrosome membrane-associated protein 4-like isoform X2 n=1 Tax=Thalassophryne amazonica TaxID=390379 RepID=UPI001471ABEB|nr:sperm acrosome membrane-associated protein 4-like isoform X2 [Thalassophryne amazonica]